MNRIAPDLAIRDEQRPTRVGDTDEHALDTV